MELKRDLLAVWPLVKESVSAWIEDFAPSMGAAIAYYTLFSIAPLLIIAIAIVGFFYGEQAAHGRIFEELQGLIGPEGAAAIQGLVKSASEPTKGIIATIVGLVTLLIGATSVFSELQSDLDRIWQVPAAKNATGLWGLIRSRILTFGMVLGIGFLLVVSLVISAGVTALATLWDGWFGDWNVLLQIVNFVAGFIVITLLFAMMYKLLPRVKIAWHDVWIGAAVTSLMFSLGKFAIGLYLGKSGVASGFGAAGSLVALLVWVYYSAQIFLLGAEFTWVYAYRYGSRRGCKKPDETVAPSAAPPNRSAHPPAVERAYAAREASAAATRQATGWPALARRKPALALGIATAAGIAAADLFERFSARIGRRGRL